MALRDGHDNTVAHARLFGTGFAALIVLLATGSWFDHLDRLQQQLRLEAAEMVQLAEALTHRPVYGTGNPRQRPPAGTGEDLADSHGSGDRTVTIASGDERQLARLLDQRLPHPTGFCQLRGPDGRLLLERGKPSGLPGLSASPDRAGSQWLTGRSHAALTGFTASSSVSLERAITLWAARNAVPGTLVLGAGLMMLSIIGRLERARADLRRTTRHALQDALTGLPNRRAFDAAFLRLGRATARDRQPISALFIDIDRFKQLNDQLGHAAGDRTLRAVAGVIRRSLLRPTDFCCRWGGEEFVVLLPDTDTRGALQTSKRILERVRHLRARSGDGPAHQVTVSVGIASQTERHPPGPELVLNADHAMLEAKRAGRDCWVVWRPTLPDDVSPDAEDHQATGFDTPDIDAPGIDALGVDTADSRVATPASTVRPS